MKKYFTANWHLGDDRIGINSKPNLFYRPFSSINEQNSTIFNQIHLSDFNDGDTLYHLGNVFYTINYDTHEMFEEFKNDYPNSNLILIKGNYDDNKTSNLIHFFDEIHEELTIEIKGRKYYLNHYPVNCIDKEFSLTGHIHGLWKVQKNMINVGVDAWHFKPVSEDEIDFCRTACEKYYDDNVFPY